MFEIFCLSDNRLSHHANLKIAAVPFAVGKFTVKVPLVTFCSPPKSCTEVPRFVVVPMRPGDVAL